MLLCYYSFHQEPTEDPHRDHKADQDQTLQLSSRNGNVRAADFSASASQVTTRGSEARSWNNGAPWDIPSNEFGKKIQTIPQKANASWVVKLEADITQRINVSLLCRLGSICVRMIGAGQGRHSCGFLLCSFDCFRSWTSASMQWKRHSATFGSVKLIGRSCRVFNE